MHLLDILGSDRKGGLLSSVEEVGRLLGVPRR
jgi:hypothetical protein